MAESGSYPQGPRLDFEQLLVEAQHRWLRPAEICEILSNFGKFQISSEPPNKPPSGSLYLFDRKVLRYFRKDGHNWRKKRDGKTVKEAHEKLKVGSVDVLHCYYAHGEDDESFQRRCYWMLEQDLMHIVFVHYLQVKGNRANAGGIRENDEVAPDLQKGSPWTSSPSNSNGRAPSGYTDYASPSSTLTSSWEDVDSGDSRQVSSLFHSVFESPKMGNGPLVDNAEIDLSLHSSSKNHDGQSSIHGVYRPEFDKDQCRFTDDSTSVIDSQKTLGAGSWEEILEQCTMGFHDGTSHASMSSTQISSTGVPLEQQTSGNNLLKEEFGSSLPLQTNWQFPLGDNSLQLPEWSLDQSMNLQRTPDANLSNAPDLVSAYLNQRNEQLVQDNLQAQLTNAESQCLIISSPEHDVPKDGNTNYAFTLRQQLLDREEGLKKVDSFSRWVSKELGEVDDLQMQSSSGISWITAECGDVVDDSSLSPSISQDQLFSIVDFSPKWAYTDSEIEVLVFGTFLVSQKEVTRYSWSCMFGEVEVPAKVLASGVLFCFAPPHSAGQVPFYVTCSNRLACSEVREFDYQVGSTKGLDMTDICNDTAYEMHLHLRLESLLSLRSVSPSGHLFGGVKENRNIISKIISLKEEEDYLHAAEPTVANYLLQNEGMEHLIKLMKEKLYTWLLYKAIEDGKGPSVLDAEGQGVLHLAAALSYNWAIKPTVTAGVSINFRDVNGWTALHWAAFYGREQTVAVLVSLGADPGALTDPSPEVPLGRTPADLASVNSHKGISGFLAESSLTTYFKSLTMNDAKEDSAAEIPGTKVVKTFSERIATPVSYGDMPDALSLKDSLTAVTNATQAADRIQQMLRMQSFERRRITEHDIDELGMPDERAISLITSKSHKVGPVNGFAHTAAVQIQKKFRGWKKRKEFLIIRQRIVKIQAHVRGHQVRKQYKAITWSVGILEKVILRWRRKGTGLRGFRPDAVAKIPSPQPVPSKEDDYDFLKKGRKQTEERLQKALTRVKSMVQYPEGRAQYRRLLNVVEGFRETKVSGMAVEGSEEKAEGGEDLIDIDKLLDDDTFMSIAFD
ncbi:calmodulin-binding transcription activator 2-like [Pyrus ussuriensis x Pyrus communis]|uniref:Calmodulin-binding transcription activator 2-like n=1 Tax=Pyrus ussuriensis x Pyrus communis TaxID=2448454 RepID=A0A5N5I5M4_9ROSA|nr:calmodulin-binding transcription activator 2-like [Pyrus ussuriensis x Pyrus communis]